MLSETGIWILKTEFLCVLRLISVSQTQHFLRQTFLVYLGAQLVFVVSSICLALQEIVQRDIRFILLMLRSPQLVFPLVRLNLSGIMQLAVAVVDMRMVKPILLPLLVSLLSRILHLIGLCSVSQPAQSKAYETLLETQISISLHIRNSTLHLLPVQLHSR